MEKFLYDLAKMHVGDRIVVPKSLLDIIQHHAIYLGVHNGHRWFIENKEGVGVRVITAQEFFRGVERITRTEAFEPRWGYSRQNLFNFALSKLGKPYHLIHYNCETFCNEVQHGVPHSRQVNILVGLVLVGLATAAIASSFGSSK